MQKIYLLLKEAIDKGELDKLIMGKENYLIPDKLIETPTDITTLFIQGFNKYPKEQNDFLSKEITTALIKLTKDPIGLWWVTYFIHSYIFNYFEGTLLFHFDINEVLKNIIKNKDVAKEVLINNKDFLGYRFAGGLWEDTERMLNLIFGNIRS